MAYLQSTTPSILLNFRLPEPLKAEFQEICTQQHVSMTARLNLMIREFLLEASEEPRPNEGKLAMLADDPT